MKQAFGSTTRSWFGNSTLHALLGIASAVVVVLIVASCDDCGSWVNVSNHLTATKIGEPEVEVKVTSEPKDRAVSPGETVRQKAEILRGPTNGATVSFTPPANVDPATVVFHGSQPMNPEGPPPYIFQGVTQGQTVDVSYDAPSIGGPGEKVVTSNFLVATGFYDAVYFTCGVTVWNYSNGVPGLRTAQEPVASPTQPMAEKSPTDDYWAWHSELWFFTAEGDLNFQQCQQAFSMIQDPNAFIAVRFPLVGDLAGEGPAWRMPVVFREGHSPHVDLIKYPWPPETVASATLEPRPDRLDFANNYLPQKDGERWLVMGGAEEPAVACPNDLLIPEGDWEFFSDVYVDLGGVEGTCSGCVLEGYACYDGQPALLGAASKLLGEIGESKTRIVHGDITCVGPFVTRMADPSNPPTPPIEVSGPGFSHVEAPAEVWFRHVVTNYGEGAESVTVEVSSEMGVDWQIFFGWWEEPDPTHPVTGPVTIPGSWNSEFYWIRAEFPDGFVGSDTVTFTATAASAPDVPVWSTDILRVGPHEEPGPGGIELPVDPTPVGEVDSSCP